MDSQTREDELIVALCTEAGDTCSDEEKIEGFRGNHHPDLIRDAANGDVAALVQLRRDCGVSPIC